MKIKRIGISNFLGVRELEWSPTNGVNRIEGPKGAGKTSIIEGIETAFTNTRRRTEVVRHGENEATLYIETDTGLEIDRRIRTEKSDYLKVKGDGAKSTETFLRNLIKGDVFRPLDFVNAPIKEQTLVILNMIDVKWSMEDIEAWFGSEIDGINYDKHILQVLKDIEVKLYKEREEINRQANVLKVQVETIKKELPLNYDGEEWKQKNIQEYYSKIAEAQNINNLIDKAKMLQDGINEKIELINAEAESDRNKIQLRYKEEEQDLKDIIELANKKINDAENVINSASDKMSLKTQELELEKQQRIQELEKEYSLKMSELEKTISLEVQDSKDLIEIQKQKIEVNNSKIVDLADKKEIELKAVSDQAAERIETEKARVGKAADYLEQHEKVEIEPLQKEADQVAEMQSYLREWDRMLGIQNGTLREKLEASDFLTNQIKIARQKPSDLLKTHKLPIEGISVDEKGQIRIKGTLLDGLSDGEKLEVAFKVALQRMGELKVMCLDGFEKLNPSEQDKVIGICEENDVQAFVTITCEKELEVK